MITPTDLKQYKSSNPNSDGGEISDVEVVNGESNNLFADIESKLAGTAYRKVFRKNTHKSLTWQNVRSWIVSQPKNALLSFGLSINHVDADSGDEGNMSPLEGNSVIAISSDGDDDRKLVLVGEDTDGNHQTEVLNLNGDTDVVGHRKQFPVDESRLRGKCDETWRYRARRKLWSLVSTDMAGRS